MSPYKIYRLTFRWEFEDTKQSVHISSYTVLPVICGNFLHFMKSLHQEINYLIFYFIYIYIYTHTHTHTHTHIYIYIYIYIYIKVESKIVCLENLTHYELSNKINQPKNKHKF